MFRLLQGFPRALRSTVQVGHNTHHRSPAATPQNNRQDDQTADTKTSLSTLHLNNQIVRLHTTTNGHDGGNTKKDDWKSFKQHDYWQSFRGAHNHYEAVGWGTAIVISLQLCRGLSTLTHPDSNSRRRRQHGPKSMLTSVAHAMPMLGRPTSGLPMRALDDKNVRTPSETTSTGTPLQNDAKKHFETSEELEEAFQQLQTVSDESVGMAHNALGLQEASQGNLHVAARHFLKGSVLGYSKAKFNMAVCYEQGRGVGQSLMKAIELYQQAAAQGHAMAQYNLGVFHLLGKGDLQIDSEKALELIATAASQGLTQAQSYLGTYYMQEPHQDAKKAFDLLKQAARKHDKEALFHLGVCCQYGLGVESNTAKAASYYHQAATKGYMPAVYSLGTFYEQGLGGLPENLQQAKELYYRASQGGCQEAAKRLKQLQKREAQRQSSSQSTRRQLLSRRTNNRSGTLKQNKSQTEIAKTIHTSSSEPVLSTTVTSSHSDIVCSDKNSNISKLSYLGLFLPYYYNSIRNRFSVTTDTANGETKERSPVQFQVGDEIDEPEVVCDYSRGSVTQVSNCLNSGVSSVLRVS